MESFQAGEDFLDVGTVAELEASFGRLGELLANTWGGVAFRTVPIRPDQRFQFGPLAGGEPLDGILDFADRAHSRKLSA